MERRLRLRRTRDFARVRAAGRSWADRLAILTVAPNDLGISRFGFVASKRLGKAVHRNRARRLLREAVRQNLSCIPTGWDCVLIARAPLAEGTFEDTQATVRQLFQRSRLWREAARSSAEGINSNQG